jgi:hypothetical protein
MFPSTAGSFADSAVATRIINEVNRVVCGVRPMAQDEQPDLLSPVSDLQLVRLLLADLHDDLLGKITRFRQLTDLSGALGTHGTMLYGGETTYVTWTEARTSFIHGNYVATVLLCQSLAEHLLAAQVALGLSKQSPPSRITFRETLELCLGHGVITQRDADDLIRLMELRNPLSHFRGIDDPSNLSRRVINSQVSAEAHLFNDARFAIAMAIRLLALPSFRLG